MAKAKCVYKLMRERERERERDAFELWMWVEQNNSSDIIYQRAAALIDYVHCVLKLDLASSHVQSLETPCNGISCSATFPSHCCNFPLQHSYTVLLPCQSLVWTGFKTCKLTSLQLDETICCLHNNDSLYFRSYWQLFRVSCSRLWSFVA